MRRRDAHRRFAKAQLVFDEAGRDLLRGLGWKEVGEGIGLWVDPETGETEDEDAAIEIAQSGP